MLVLDDIHERYWEECGEIQWFLALLRIGPLKLALSIPVRDLEQVRGITSF